MFPTTTKDKPLIAGPAYLREYLAWNELPHLAIGGITPENVGELVAAGARAVAVSAAVCGAERPDESGGRSGLSSVSSCFCFRSVPRSGTPFSTRPSSC